MLSRFFDRVIAVGFYVLFFFTPLLFNPSRTLPSFELFEWNKMMFIYGMTTVIVGAWIGRMIIARKIYFKRTPFDLPLLLFLLSQSLATLFSIDRHVSIFGYYSRFHGGLLSTVSYILLYYAFVANRGLVNVKRLLLFAISSGTVVALYGIAEKFGIDAHMWVQDVRARVFSTLGQPNWLAAYLDILLLLAICQLVSHWVSQRSVIRNSQMSRLMTLGSGSLVLIFYICLLFTKSRSGFLGFWAGNAVFWVVYFLTQRPTLISIFRHPGNASKKLHPEPVLNSIQESESGTDSGQARMTVFIVLNSLLLILNFFLKTPFSQYNRLATIEVISKQPIIEETKPPIGDSVINIGITDSGKIRQIVWKGAIDIAKDYPLFGTGPETFAFAYYKYRPAEHNLTSEWDFLYNRAHNEFLNIAATSGYFGLGTYLLLITTVIFWAIKKTYSIVMLNSFQHPHHVGNTNGIPKQVRDDKLLNNVLFIIALLASYISILITNFFGFSVVIVGLYFFLIPAFMNQLIYNDLPVDVSVRTESAQIILPHQRIILVVVGTVVIFILFTLGRYWKADSLYAKASSHGRLGNWQDAYAQIIEASRLRPDEPVYLNERAEVATNLAELDLESEQATTAAEHAREAISQSSKALVISPQNVNFWKTRTKIFFLLSQIDPIFTQNTLDTIRIAQELAPTDAKIAYNVAVILGRADKNQEAIAMLNKTIELKPDYRDAYIGLAIFYEEVGQIEKAREILKMALIRINPDDQEIKERLEKLK